MKPARGGPDVAHVVGARPNFMKAAPVVAALGTAGIEQVLIHTGQHYDEALSRVFFDELALPEPDRYLGVGSGTQAVQTAALLTALEGVLADTAPTLTLVYGDVNSTMAAALVASKAGLASGHVEAGLRSFDRSMPEEINRVVTDALADIHFVTTTDAIANLAKEGASADSIHFVGNPMIDTLLLMRDRFVGRPIGRELGLPERYAVVTLHRPGNVDDPQRATEIVNSLVRVANDLHLVIPLHPRGRAKLTALGLTDWSSIDVTEPLGYLDFMSLVADATAVITDSGGVQEETTVLGIPCITVRPNTERAVTITHGTNRLTEPEDLDKAVAAAISEPPSQTTHGPPPLWDGGAGPRIGRIVQRWIDR